MPNNRTDLFHVTIHPRQGMSRDDIKLFCDWIHIQSPNLHRWVIVTEPNRNDDGVHLHSVIQFTHSLQTQQNILNSVKRLMKHHITDDVSDFRCVVVTTPGKKKNLDFYCLAAGYFAKDTRAVLIAKHGVDEHLLLMGEYKYKEYLLNQEKKLQEQQQNRKRTDISPVRLNELMLTTFKHFAIEDFRYRESEGNFYRYLSLSDSEQIDRCYEYLFSEGFHGINKHTLTFKRNTGKYWRSFNKATQYYIDDFQHLDDDVDDDVLVDFANYMEQQLDERIPPLTYAQKQYKIKQEIRCAVELVKSEQMAKQYAEHTAQQERQRLIGLHGMSKSNSDNIVYDVESEPSIRMSEVATDDGEGQSED